MYVSGLPDLKYVPDLNFTGCVVRLLILEMHLFVLFTCVFGVSWFISLAISTRRYFVSFDARFATIIPLFVFSLNKKNMN